MTGRWATSTRILPPLSWRSRRTRSPASRTTRATTSWKAARCPTASTWESNGPTNSSAAISQVDRLQSEPESIRKWREEQKERLEQLDANSRKQEAEWKEKAIKELEEWYARQDEKLQKTKASNRAAEEAFVNDAEDVFPGTEWERVAQLCDFNPKSSKQAKDVSRMRSVLISLKQAPLVR
ncbi:clathrin light chain A isoform 3-T4 [Alca torda]